MLVYFVKGFEIHLSNLSEGMDTGVGTTASNDFNILFQDHSKNLLQLLLHRIRVGLTLPTAVIGTVVRNFNKVSTQWRKLRFDLIVRIHLFL